MVLFYILSKHVLHFEEITNILREELLALLAMGQSNLNFLHVIRNHLVRQRSDVVQDTLIFPRATD